MNATMKTMELILADFLAPDQLMEGDIIKSPEQELVIVKTITATDLGYTIEATNDFDEVIEFWVGDDTMFNWYVYPPDDD